MKERLLNIKLPDKYKDGLINYSLGLDNVPDWLALQEQGWTFQEHLKLEKLIEIEHMKYSLNEAINENEITREEIKEIEDLIANVIKEYNDI